MLISCSYVSIILYRTFASSINMLDLFGAADRRMHLQHIQLQLLTLQCRLLCLARIATDWLLGVDAHSGRLFRIRDFANSRNIGNGVRALAWFIAWNLQSHKTGYVVLTQINVGVIWILILSLLRGVSVLESVDVLANGRKITLITNVGSRYFGDARNARNTSRAMSIFIITSISQIIIEFWCNIDATPKIIRLFRSPLLRSITFIYGGYAKCLFEYWNLHGQLGNRDVSTEGVECILAAGAADALGWRVVLLKRLHFGIGRVRLI